MAKAKSGVVRHDDLVEDGAIRDHIGRELETLVSYLPVVEAAVKKTAGNLTTYFEAVNLGGTTVEQFNKLNEKLKESNDLYLINQKRIKATAEANAKLAQQRKAEISEKKAQIDLDKKINTEKEREEKLTRKNSSAYAQLSKELSDQKKIYKDYQAQIALGNRLTDEQAAAMLKARDAAKFLDAKIKDIDYTVGDAQRNVGNYHNQLGTLSKSIKGFGALGKILGNVLGIDTQVFQDIAETGRAIKDLKHILDAEKLSEEGATVATEAHTVALEAEAVAGNLSGGAVFALTGFVVAAGVAIVQYILYLKDQKEEEMAIKKVEEERLQLFIKAKKLQTEIAIEKRNLNEEQKVLDGEITEAQKNKNLLLSDERLSTDENKRAEIRLLKEAAKGYKIDVDEFGNAIKTKTIMKRVFEEKSSRLVEDEEAQKKYVEGVAEYEAEALTIRKQASEDRKDLENITSNAITTINQSDQKKANEEYLKRLKEAKELEEKLLIKTNEIQKKLLGDTKKRLEDGARESVKRKEDEIESSMSKDLKKRQEFNKKVEQTDKLNSENKLLADKERIEKRNKFEDQLTEGLKDGLNKRSELQQQADQKDIDFHARSIDIQSKLAAAGKDNVLGEEMAAATRAEEKKLQDAKKAQRLQENITLVKTFADTLQKELDKGSPFLKAFGKAAAAEGLVAAMFSKLISGSAFDGTEDTGAGKGMDNKNGMLYMVHPNERILTKKDNMKLNGMTNQELVDNALMFENLYKPLFSNSISTGTSEKKQAHDYLMTSILSKKIESLQQAIEGKPVTNVRLESLGQWSEEIQGRGIKTIIHHKRQSVRPSLRING